MSAPTPRVRLAPDARREQLLDLGVRMLSTGSLDELSIERLAEEAGVSRGLLYHYFESKTEFRLAVCRRAADELVTRTAPAPDGEPLDRLMTSLDAYVDYVSENYAGYTSLLRSAAGGNDELREIYEQARAALTDRIFDVADADGILEAISPQGDTPATRLMVRGWSALAEEVVVSWVRDHRGVSRQDLLTLLAAALPGVLPGAS